MSRPLGVAGLEELVIANLGISDDTTVLAAAYWDYVIQDLIHRADEYREVARQRALEHPSSFAATMEHSGWLTLRTWLRDQLDDGAPQAGGAARPTETTVDITSAGPGGPT